MRVFLIMVIFMTSLIGQVKTEHYIVQEVNELTNFFKEQNWDDLQFRLIIHEILTNEEFSAFEKHFEKMPQYNSLNHQYESISLNNNHVKIIYDIKSDQWDETAQKEFATFIKSDIFRLNFENSRLYPCFQTHLNGNINSNFIREEISHYFNIKIENRLIEKEFQVYSGSTHFFKQFIPLNNSEINIQFSVREIDETIKIVTIGTPILVIEY